MKKAAKILDLIAVVLMVIFFAYSSFLGGDAFNGIAAPRLAENYVLGEYYVANNGVFSQVTHWQWVLSLIITCTFWAALLAALIVNVVAMVKKQSKEENQEL